jgi:hypothetical protein
MRVIYEVFLYKNELLFNYFDGFLILNEFWSDNGNKMR